MCKTLLDPGGALLVTQTAFDAALAGLIKEDGQRDYLVVSHPVDRPLHSKLSRLLAEKRKHDSCTVFLTTWGGDPNGGYRVARCLRHHYTKQIRVAVPSFCKSAGTLIAIAADELAIGDMGELGPLDIQVRKSSELAENSSGLDIMQAMQAVTSHTQDAFHRLLVATRGLGLSTRLCAEYAATVAAGIAAPLISQIDPIRLGEMQRATRVAYEYGQRLNAYRSNLKDGALEKLVGEYPAHGFVIDRKEAGELFNRVCHLTEAEREFVEAVWNFVERETGVDPVLLEFPDEAAGTPYENANVPNNPSDAGEAQEAVRGIDRVDTAEGVEGDPAEANGQGVSVRSIGNRRQQKT